MQFKTAQTLFRLINIYIQYRSSLIVGIFASPNISSSSDTSIFLSKVMEISKHWDLFEYNAIRGLCCTETRELITELTRNCYLNVEWIMTAFYFVCHGSKRASLFCDIISTEFENTELDNDNWTFKLLFISFKHFKKIRCGPNNCFGRQGFGGLGSWA